MSSKTRDTFRTINRLKVPGNISSISRNIRGTRCMMTNNSFKLSRNDLQEMAIHPEVHPKERV